MFNFAFGVTTGIVIGVAGSFVAVIIAAVVVEDSTETQDMLIKIFETFND